MGDRIEFSITIPLDERGMIGRECLECKRYFKLKPGTGLPTNECHCPYCEYKGSADTFWTPAQLEYARSIAYAEAMRRIIKPAFDKLANSFKELERSTRGGLFQIKVNATGQDLSVPVKYYAEDELETLVVCDSCGLHFSIYGVFAHCPDCNECNAFLIYERSLDVARKQLEILAKPGIPEEIMESSMSFVISSCVAAFDALGKELRARKPYVYPGKPKNLFQNITLLDERIGGLISRSSDYELLIKMFQVRHIYEHNLGVVDSDFVRKIPDLAHLLGRKYKISVGEVENFVDVMREVGSIIRAHFNSVRIDGS